MAEALCEEVAHWCHLTASALSRSSEREVLGLVHGLNQYCRERALRMMRHAGRHKNRRCFVLI